MPPPPTRFSNSDILTGFVFVKYYLRILNVAPQRYRQLYILMNCLMFDQPRSATVMAMEKTEVLVLSFSDLERIISGNPEFLFILIQVLCKRIRFTTCQIRNFSIKSISGGLRIYY